MAEHSLQEHGPVGSVGLVATLNGVLTLSDEPSAVMGESGEILSCNSAWREEGAHETTLRGSLDGFNGVDELIDAIRSGSSSGSVTVSGVSGIASGTSRARRYDAHWQRLGCSCSNEPGYTVVVLKPSRSDDAAGGRIGADRLMVRQALIEEGERLRIGRVLHDSVIQDLAWMRKVCASTDRANSDSDDCVGTIDRLIDRVRTLTFELSPPILADLGLVAALHWLGEYIGGRYDAAISVVDDENEPALSHTEKTIVFRCVRELSINAAKYASGGEIIISCRSTPTQTVIRVRDHGPGFDAAGMRSSYDESKGFGLVSVDQQIRGIGGRFELVSEVGAGTRATLRVPLRAHYGVSHG